MPVKTIASPARSAAAITASSRTEPPGWMAAVTPAAIAVSKPSGNGEEGIAGEYRAGGPSPALSTAMRTLSSRLGWPLPTPVKARSAPARWHSI